MAKLKLILPYPPTINHYYGRQRGGGVYIKPKGEIYRKLVWLYCVAEEVTPLEGPLKAVIAADKPDNRKRDLDNIQKCLLDALENAGVYEDDCQIHDLRTYWVGYDPPDGRVVVTLQELSGKDK